MNKYETALLDVGIPASQHGFKYLVYALNIVELDERYLYNTMDMYLQIGLANNTTPSCAERAIRHSIETAWNRRGVANCEKYFGNSVNPMKGKPTNSEFIATLALVLKEEKDGTTA